MRKPESGMLPPVSKMPPPFSPKKRYWISSQWIRFIVGYAVLTIAFVAMAYDYNIVREELRTLKAQSAVTPAAAERYAETVRKGPEYFSPDMKSASVADAASGSDGKTVYFVPRSNTGYTRLRNVIEKNVEAGYVYVDPDTGGVIVEIGSNRIGVK